MEEKLTTTKIGIDKRDREREGGRIMSFTNTGPVIEKFPDDTFATEKEAVLLSVSLIGYPKPSVAWYCDEHPLGPDDGVKIQSDGSVFIPCVQVKHNGVYRLVATNSLGTAQRSFSLFVKSREFHRIIPHTNLVIKPVPMEQFGEYVASNHANDNKGFKNQFMVQR